MTAAIPPPAPEFASREVDQVANLEAFALERINVAENFLNAARRELRQGKYALSILNVTEAEQSLVRAHWPLIRLTGVKP